VAREHELLLSEQDNGCSLLPLLQPIFIAGCLFLILTQTARMELTF
jgi:hypothetical protein